MRRKRRWWLRGLVALVVVLAVGELVARFGLGLGDPPLFTADPKIGYFMTPGVSHPLGNTVTINRWSMRCADLPERKADPRELRVLVIGDSVVFGGSLTDDRELATVLLEADLAKALGRPVRVANISCGSWSPGNELAYLKRYGTFEADVAVLVFNSLDYGAVVRPGPLLWAQPSRKPMFALEEGVKRFIVRFAPSLTPQANPVDEFNPSPADATRSLADLREMVELLRSRGIKVGAVQHPRYTELTGTMLPGHAKLAEVLAGEGVPTVQTGPAMKAAVDRGENPYRDDIHPTAAGQRVLRDVLRQAFDAASAATR